MSELKYLLDKVLSEYPPINRVSSDPVQFQRRFFVEGKSQTEVEAVAVFSAMLSYGSAAQFTKKIASIMQSCNMEFLNLITKEPDASFPWVGYRMSTADEISKFAYSIGNVIKKYGSLKKAFLIGYNTSHNIIDGLSTLRDSIFNEAELIINPVPHGIKHLLPDPKSGGCCKRWHMFLRWMVRQNDGVDIGIWKEVSPSELIIPLDTHISKISRNLGLTSRKNDDLKTAIEITNKLKECCPEDPIKYDFAICHLGIGGKCTYGKNPELCIKCLLKSLCSIGKEKNDRL
jgi:uncharacterized protein (TIGR02757 family)